MTIHSALNAFQTLSRALAALVLFGVVSAADSLTVNSDGSVVIGTDPNLGGSELLRVGGSVIFQKSVTLNKVGALGTMVDIVGGKGRYGLGFFSNSGRATTGLICNSEYGAAEVSLGGWDGATFTQYLRAGPATNGAVVVGVGSGWQHLDVSGGNSGTSDGGAIIIKNNGGQVGVFGNYSAVFGGAYNANSVLWSSGVLNFTAGGIVGSHARVNMDGSFVVGGEPGGSELLRVGGGARFTNVISAMDAPFYSQRSGTSGIAFETSVVGDASDRYRIRANGQMDWGDGANATDISLYRSAPGTLSCSAHIVIGSDSGGSELLRVGGGVQCTALTVAGGGIASAGNLTLGTNTSSGGMIVNGAPGSIKTICQVQRAGVASWQMDVRNANDNLTICAYNDAGTVIDYPLTISRYTGGPITLTRPLTTASVAVTGSATIVGPVRTMSACYIKARLVTTSTTLTSSDEAVKCTVAGVTITLPAAADGRRLLIKNRSGGNITIAPNSTPGTDTVDGASVATLGGGQGCTLVAISGDWVMW